MNKTYYEKYILKCWIFCLYIYLRYSCLLQELDSIVNQMMTVAEYLGWDVTQLKPVSYLGGILDEVYGSNVF